MFLTHNTCEYISNKLIYCMRDTYNKWEPEKLESNHFPNTLVFNDL